MKYKHIVFDVDGTLIDNEYAIICSLYRSLEKVNYKIADIEELLFSLGIPGKDALEKLNVEDIETTLELWNQEMITSDISVQLFDGIDDVIMKLRELGYKIGIVTSKTQDEYVNEVSKFGIDEYFDYFVFADMTIKHKPNPDPLEKYLEITKCKADEVLYIGDSIYDKECAERCGIDFVLVQWGMPRVIEQEVGCIVDYPNQLLELV